MLQRSYTNRIAYLGRRKIKNMLLLFGSTCALVAGILIYTKSRKNWPLVFHEILYEIKYNVLGSKGLIIDRLEARYNKTDMPRKTGKIAIVTGGSRGIGATVVKMLLQCDMEVIIACRAPAAGEKAIREIRKSGVNDGIAKVYELDNADLNSVRRFADCIKRDYSRIDVLVNNAGIMFTPYAETKDGFEQQWAINYLSHFLLTSLLLPLLKNGGSPSECARVVNVSSCAHLVGIINFENINYKEQFITSAAYAQSKLAQVMFTKSLQQLFTEKQLHIKTYAVHPGIVNTDLFNDTLLSKYFKWLLPLIFKTPTEGATPIVYAAVSKSVEERGGIYISNCKESPVNPLVSDASILDRLFELSLKQVRLNDFFQEL
ncbi:dehydrogenase/reductase SDR family member on chromosome X [Cephus cinctus]|uniref:Dehydrogenase/reductase SDR family member on chromosome X n=1 Tax=Cephus cinctus TaxID=211228 RepID=A0AAJ7C6W9_CEPCN|nr:dehydrogenase/reductase SDR family member on chromosome X [Cephus cinctus]XP_015603426.1 dehydrogenase/reductase SDR family member on chromosome X [Cephus cinctus]